MHVSCCDRSRHPRDLGNVEGGRRLGALTRPGVLEFDDQNVAARVESGRAELEQELAGSLALPVRGLQQLQVQLAVRAIAAPPWKTRSRRAAPDNRASFLAGRWRTRRCPRSCWENRGWRANGRRGSPPSPAHAKGRPAPAAEPQGPGGDVGPWKNRR